MPHDSKFWDRIAERYFAKPIEDPAAYEEKLRMTQEHFRADMTVLEFGCGTGGTALRHAPFVQHVHATDISDAMLSIARRQAAERGVENVSFECADIADFAAPEESYDAVLGLSILHLLEDPEDIARRVFRWLKPGGLFVSSTACLGDHMGWFRYVGPIGKALGKMPYVNVFSTDELLAAVTDAGFSIETHWQAKKGRAVFLICKKPH